MSKNKFHTIILFIIAGIIVVFTVLYFILDDLLYLKLGLLSVGVLNMINGFVAVRNGISSVATIYLAGGAALTLVMIYSLFI